MVAKVENRMVKGKTLEKDTERKETAKGKLGRTDLKAHATDAASMATELRTAEAKAILRKETAKVQDLEKDQT